MVILVTVVFQDGLEWENLDGPDILVILVLVVGLVYLDIRGIVVFQAGLE